mgnify:CR=1 FL=1
MPVRQQQPSLVQWNLLVAVVVGVLVFSEHFTLQSLIGLLLILMSVIIVILADQQKKVEENHRTENH